MTKKGFRRRGRVEGRVEGGDSGRDRGDKEKDRGRGRDILKYCYPVGLDSDRELGNPL